MFSTLTSSASISLRTQMLIGTSQSLQCCKSFWYKDGSIVTLTILRGFVELAICYLSAERKEVTSSIKSFWCVCNHSNS